MCGGGVELEQFDDTSVHLLSKLFNRVSIGLWWPLVFKFADTGNVDDDFIICDGITENDSSCKPSNFSNSFGSLAPGKSCLLAKIKIGTPCSNKKKKTTQTHNFQLSCIFDFCEYFDEIHRFLRDFPNILLYASVPFWLLPCVPHPQNRRQIRFHRCIWLVHRNNNKNIKLSIKFVYFFCC